MMGADVRHLRRMLHLISGMRAGEYSLVDGANDLLALRDALEEFDAFGQGWFDDFTSHLVTLESAGVTSSGKALLHHRPLAPYVRDALDGLEAMILERLPS